MSFVALPLDVAHHILASLRDYASLRAIILTASHFAALFHAHPRSIMASIALNILGAPSVPSAYRLARYALWRDRFRDSDSLPLPPFLDESSLPSHRPLTWLEAQRISEFAQYAFKFEHLFSARYKCSRSPTTQLLPDESTRFLNAFFRVFLYYTLPSPPVQHGSPSQNGNDIDGGHNPQLTVIDTNLYFDNALQISHDSIPAPATQIFDRSMLLPSLSASDLLDFDQVHHFLQELLHDATMQDLTYGHVVQFHTTRLLSCGAKALYEYYSMQSRLINVHFLDQELVPDEQMSNLRAEHKLENTLSWDSYIDSGGLVHNAIGLHDSCSHCLEVKGLELRSLSSSNDFNIWRKFQVYRLSEKLPGLLPRNVTESTQWRRFVLDREGHLTIQTILNEIYDMHLPQVAHWNREDRLCLSCVDNIIKACMRDWWASCRTPPVTETTDCWWGQECKTQVHNNSHALRRNHVCPWTGKPNRRAPSD